MKQKESIIIKLINSKFFLVESAESQQSLMKLPKIVKFLFYLMGNFYLETKKVNFNISGI